MMWNDPSLRELPAKKMGVQIKEMLPMIQEHLLDRIWTVLQNENRQLPGNPALRETSIPVERMLDTMSRDSKRQPVMTMTVHVANTSTHSCHTLVFGEQRPVNLYGRPLAALEDYCRLRPEQKDAVLDILNESAQICSNPIYTFLDRAREYSAFHGYSLNTWLSHFSIAPQDGGFVSRLLQEPASPEIDLMDNKAAHYSMYFPWLCVCAAIYSDLPVDYFLRQDYSSLAQAPDWVLLPGDREFLSAWLCASQNGRFAANAIFFRHRLNDT